MLRISWRPQMAIPLHITHRTQDLSPHYTCSWGATMLPRCSDLLASTAKASSNKFDPKQPLKRYEYTTNSSKSSGRQSGREH
jgi:hypothetical protein